jgi:hypothetical protein
MCYSGYMIPLEQYDFLFAGLGNQYFEAHRMEIESYTVQDNIPYTNGKAT